MFDFNIHAKKAEMKKNAKMQQKKAEMQKKAKNACSISKKDYAKKDKNSKKEQKCILNFEIHTKKGKKKAHFLEFFCFDIPCAYFCIFNLKIHAKKTKMKKGQ